MLGANYIKILTQVGDSRDWKLKNITNWELKLCLLPRKCFISDQYLFGKMAYKGTKHIRGPDETLLQKVIWIEKHTFLLWQLGVKNDFQ